MLYSDFVILSLVLLWLSCLKGSLGSTLFFPTPHHAGHGIAFSILTSRAGGLRNSINAEHPDVRLILFPETTLGYYYRRSNLAEYQRSIAETIPGITTNVISQKAYEHQIYISFGMVELSGEVLFNSQVLIGPDGLIRSVYRKRNLVPQDRRNGFTEGRDFVLDIIDNIKVATIICADIDSLRVNRDIHRSGAELVLLPVATETSPLNNLLPHNGHLRGY